jgi:TRAP-type C4-dicarboxylate transport system permease small subunit
VKIFRFVSRLLGYIAAVILGVMMMLTVVDVFFRYILNAPLTGAIEISELLMVVLVFPALGWIAIERSHIRVDLLVSTWPRRVQFIVEIITLLLTLGTYGIITWQSILESREVGMATSLLSIPEAPFHWVMTVGFLMLCLAIVSLVVEDLVSLGKEKKEGKRR